MKLQMTVWQIGLQMSGLVESVRNQLTCFSKCLGQLLLDYSSLVWQCHCGFRISEITLTCTNGLKAFAGVKFTNFLRAAFLSRFMSLQFVFVTFCQKEIGAKAACKMLLKFTTGGVNQFFMSVSFMTI